MLCFWLDSSNKLVLHFTVTVHLCALTGWYLQFKIDTDGNQDPGRTHACAQ